MATPADLNLKIAEKVVASAAGQIDVVHALALATIGGAFAFALQVALHNKKKDVNPVSIGWFSILMLGIAVIFEVAALTVGALARGALTSSIPSIYQANFVGINKLADLEHEGADILRVLVGLQAIAFVVGVAFFVFFFVYFG